MNSKQTFQSFQLMRTEGINTNTATLNVHNLFCDFEKKTNPNSSIEKKKKKSHPFSLEERTMVIKAVLKKKRGCT